MSNLEQTKLQQWTHSIQAWRDSGMTRRAYCEREGLSFASFEYWCKKIRATAPTEPVQQKALRNARPPLTFIPAQRAAPQTIAKLRDEVSLHSIVLHNPGGWQLNMPLNVDRVWLAELLKSLA